MFFYFIGVTFESERHPLEEGVEMATGSISEALDVQTESLKEQVEVRGHLGLGCLQADCGH